MIYKGEKATEISFPLGGIGSGCVGIAGDGRLVDWEIFNKPNKNSRNGFSHFAIKAEEGKKVLDAWVLCGPLHPSYMGSPKARRFGGFGFGPDRETMAGMPNFSSVEFRGEYPFAELSFKDAKFPGAVAVTAWNPFIPLNDKDSSIPAAFFEITVRNTTRRKLDYTLALVVQNPHGKDCSVNTCKKVGKLSGIQLGTAKDDASESSFGDLTVATDAAKTSHQEYWFRGGWFDNLGIYWQDMRKAGSFKNRRYDAPGGNDHCTLAAHVSVKPGGTERVRFVLSWSFPNCVNYWSPEQSCGCEGGCGEGQGKPKSWRNYYATVFKDSVDSAAYCLKNWGRLFEETRLFKDALFGSDLPPPVIDAVSANLSLLKSPTVLRLEDGSFYGFEGCHCDEGCCEGSCTHVWNYAYSLPFLFPKLERSMRDLNYAYNQREDGGLVFRIKLPLGRARGDFRPCVDGQFGDVIKMYRDWKICGDTEWLRGHWQAIRKSIEFAWAPTNEDRWDADKDGVLEGRQHHTLDMELFGPNSWLTGFYLAALKAGAEMAESLGENGVANEYRALFDKGRKWVDANLFNGEYYQQKIQLDDKGVVDRFNAANYWNDEHKEIKYQIGEGSAVDQVVAQWHANIAGLGEIFDKGQVRQALKAIHTHNYKRSFRDFVNPCRLYSLYDEKGVVICDWPEGARKPVVPVPYSEETMYGFEYAAAAHMIQEGVVREGLEIAESVREKFDGAKRNPWNEFECGSNYARSMASYALLTALSGFEFDMTRGMIGFNPVLNKGAASFKCFWSIEGAWGVVEFKKKVIALSVLYGELNLRSFRSMSLRGMRVKSVKVGAVSPKYVVSDGEVRFGAKVKLAKGRKFVIAGA